MMKPEINVEIVTESEKTGMSFFEILGWLIGVFGAIALFGEALM